MIEREFGMVPGYGGGGGSAYAHTQSSPATTWTVTHGLGYRPAVMVVGPDGQEVDAAVSWPTLNSVVITLAASMAGSAYLT